MAASLEGTSESKGENQINDFIDYVQLLRVSLRQKKLIYIADAILKVEELTLEQLMKCTRNELSDLLADIHNDKDNDYKIKASHRIKFAETVTNMAAQQQDALQKQTATPSTSSQLKLLFLGKEEEEAIESIQSGQQFMEKNLIKMKELFNNLDENNKNVKQNLDKICKSLKQQIDEKQKEIVSMIDTIHKYHSNGLNKKNEITQQSSKVVDKFYNDYESCCTDSKMTKSDRQDKLNAVKNGISVEYDKIKKLNEVTYNMNIEENKDAKNQFFKQFINVNNIGSQLNLEAVAKPELDGYKIHWKSPVLHDDIIKCFKTCLDNDNKEEPQLVIGYNILYRKINDEKDEKHEHEWNVFDVGKVNSYDMTKFTPCEAAIQYNINNMIKAPMSIPVILMYIAKWSSQYKGDRITLSENDTIALMAKSNEQTVRAVQPIQKGMIVKLQYKFNNTGLYYEIVGVASSEFVDYYNANSDILTPYRNKDFAKYCYGASFYVDGSDRTHHYYGGYKDLGWCLASNYGDLGGKGKQAIVQMVV
eukprot:5936_1